METIQSIEKASLLLDLFTRQRPSLTLADMAGLLGWHRPTTLRIANTLVKVGLLEQRKEGRNVSFQLGLRILRMASAVTARLDIRHEAVPHLRRLAEGVGDTSYLLLRRGERAVCVERVPGSYIVLALALNVGDTLPLHVGGATLAMFAHLADDERDSVLDALRLSGPDRALVERRLSDARLLGYAVSRDEVAPQTAAVGAPIFDRSGTVVAGISIGGPADRFGDDRIEGMGALLKEAAQNISARLGYTGV